MRGLRVHVVGDTIVDSYSTCSLLGATAKSPTFSVKHEQTEVFAGGAAVVAKHVKAAGRRGHLLDRARATTRRRISC